MVTGERERRRSCLDWFVANPVIVVRAWRHPLIDRCGFDARDSYVEMFWLPILGPSAVLAVRRLVDWLEQYPDGFDLDLVEFGASVGIRGGTARHAQVNRTLGRLIDFSIARIEAGHLEVHTSVPPVPLRLRRGLPASLRDALVEFDRIRLSTA